MALGHSVGSSDGIILSFDNAVRDMLHRASADIVGRSYLELTHRQDRTRNALQLSCLQSDGTPTCIRKRYLRPDGSTIWVSTTVSRLVSGNDAGRLIGTLEWADDGRQLNTPAVLWEKAHCLDAALHRRIAVLGRELFTDYAWFIMLKLYLAEAEGRLSTNQGLAATTDIPGGVVDRWLIVLEQKGLVERDYSGGMVAQLTGAGLDRIEDLIAIECP